MDFSGVPERVAGLCSGEYHFGIVDVAVFEEQHIPEIDSIAQIGKEPEVPVLFQGFGAAERNDGRNLFPGQSIFPL